MYLIAVIASLLADYRFPDYIDLRRFSLYRFIAKTFISMGIGSTTVWLPYVLITIVPALIVKMAISIVGFVFIIELIFWVFILFVCLPSEPISKTVKAYVDACKSGDKRIIDLHAETLLDSQPSIDNIERNHQLSRAVLSEQNMHVVAVFFWFLIMGIGAAVFYKLNWVLRESKDAKLRDNKAIQSHVQIALGLMSWIPARLLMLAYALVGNFTSSLKNLFKKRISTENRFQGSIRMLADSGIAAMRLDQSVNYTEEHVSKSWALVRRANIALLTACIFISVFNFIAWY